MLIPELTSEWWQGAHRAKTWGRAFQKTQPVIESAPGKRWGQGKNEMWSIWEEGFKNLGEELRACPHFASLDLNPRARGSPCRWIILGKSVGLSSLAPWHWTSQVSKLNFWSRSVKSKQRRSLRVTCELEWSIQLNCALSVASRGYTVSGGWSSIKPGRFTEAKSLLSVLLTQTWPPEIVWLWGSPISASISVPPFPPSEALWRGVPSENGLLEAGAKIVGSPVIFPKVKLPRCGGGSLPAPLFPESVYPHVSHIPGNQRTFVDSETDWFWGTWVHL